MSALVGQSGKTKTWDGGLLQQPAQDVVLGIDQSYTGFAVTALAKKGDPRFMTWVYTAPETGIDRLFYIRDFLASRISMLEEERGFPVVAVAMEDTIRQSPSASILGELAGIVKMTLRESATFAAARYPLRVPPTSLKKYVAGKGNGVKKSQMLLAVYKTWGVEFDDDNAADSYGLAHIAARRADQRYAYQREVLTRLADPKFRDRPS